LGLVYLLVESKVSYELSLLLAVIAASVSNFVLNKKLTFKEKREFETLEKEIDELTKEKELVDLRLNANDTSFEELQKLSNRIGEVTKLLDEKELRWLELSELAQ